MERPEEAAREEENFESGRKFSCLTIAVKVGSQGWAKPDAGFLWHRESRHSIRVKFAPSKAESQA